MSSSKPLMGSEMEMVERTARAICKACLSDVRTYGDEICCQFFPASRRREGETNNNVKLDRPLRCCWEDFTEEAEAAISAIERCMNGTINERSLFRIAALREGLNEVGTCADIDAAHAIAENAVHCDDERL